MTATRTVGNGLVTIGSTACDTESLTGPRNRTLEAAGWRRRFLADEQRAREAVTLYESLGLEARAERLRPADFGAACDACSTAVCVSHVLVYTRERAR